MPVQTEQQLAQVYYELRTYVKWDDQDIPLVQMAHELIAPEIPALIDDFYEEIQRHPATLSVLVGGQAQIERLKSTLSQWIHDLFFGTYDDAFVAARWRVGRRHVEIGLDQHFATAALARLRLGLCEKLKQKWVGDSQRLLRTLIALQRLIDLDIAIIQLAYQQHFLRRVAEESQRQLQQSERLASIGQMVTGLAHESRNMLQRSHACLETLILDIEDRPDALKQARRIQAALDQLHLLYEEVRNFAAPILLDREEIDLRRVIVTAWQHLESYRHHRAMEFQIDWDSADACRIAADPRRIDQVITNILQNSLDACVDRPDPKIVCRLSRLESPARCQITIEDNGMGFDGDAGRVFEPFYTTKPKGTGLGMAISKRIIDAHQGSIRIERGGSSGARVTIEIPHGGSG
jgi:signal transduction histidine kinase